MKSLEESVQYHGLQRGCWRYIKNSYNRKSSVKKRVEYILSTFKVVYFCTYTINDDYINSNIDFVRILKRLFKKYPCTYIFNEDYGEKNGRLHYHVLIGFNEKIDYKNIIWKYGACNFETVRLSQRNNSIKKISSYINKLSNHTRGYKVVYSRKCSSLVERAPI